VPRKATWLRLETDPAFNFSFFLAAKLGKTVGEIERMPNREWLDWSVYFGREAQRQELANMRGR
jgi:hypothetical protein